MANKFTIQTILQLQDKITDPSKKISKAFNGIGTAIKGVIAVFGVRQIINIGKQFVEAAADVEKYKAVLTTMLGSQEAANERFEEMSKFASYTPFELNEVVELGNQLQALNQYSIENMTRLGDLAAAAGKPIDQVTNAFAKLVSGQKGMAVDMFRDLLITTDDWVEATGKGIDKSGSLIATTTEMLAALPAILEKKGFSGMMEEQSKTFNGAMSNMQDSMTRLKAAVGENLLGPLGGVAKHITDIVGKITEWVIANKDLIGQKIEAVFSTMAEFGSKLWSVLKSMWEVVGPLVQALGTGLLDAFRTIIGPLQDVWTELSKVFGLMDTGPNKINILGKAFESLTGFLGGAVATVLMVVGSALDMIATQIQIVGKGVSILGRLGDKDYVQKTGAEMNDLFSGFLNRSKEKGVAIGGVWKDYYEGFTPVSPNTGGGSGISDKTAIDILFSGQAPAGTTITQSKQLPNVTVDPGMNPFNGGGGTGKR